MKNISLKIVLALFAVLAFGGEFFLAWQSLVGPEGFPVDETYFVALDKTMRDVVLFAIVLVLYYRRKRVPDRFRRYFPVIVVGVLYLAVAFFMIFQLNLDHGIQTTLAVLAGINNNILLVLLAAMCYHKWPNLWMKGLYFFAYVFSCLTIIGDGFYFWQTSMHVESVLFQNLNIYAVKGVFATMSNYLIGGMVVAVVAVLGLFQVSKPQRRKPNFAWSLLCVSMFTIGLNLTDRVVGSLGMYCVEAVFGFDAEIEAEKTRHLYRNMLSVPINGNFVSKALFDTDKIVVRSNINLQELPERHVSVLKEMGIDVNRPKLLQRTADYDRIVVLILESVHRDYINAYNSNVPKEATPFLNSLLQKYPHINKYYSSAVPTTQGLNATFRSHLIFDGDIPGKHSPSIFRTVHEAGIKGIFMNASSQYYNNEFRQYKEQFGMDEYYAKEDLEKKNYKGASGWGYHNDVMYAETIEQLKKHRKDKLFLVTKTLDMHQPYPYTGITWANTPDECVRDNPYFTVRGMYWVDRTLKDFFAAAEEHGLMDDRTLFIITSDHNPHSGGEYTNIVTNKNDKMSIAPIPLIFVSKNLKPLAGIRSNEFASQIDFAPTVLQLFGLSVSDLFMGRSLLKHESLPYALGYFGGKLYYWSEEKHFVDQMDNPTPETKYEDALTDYTKYIYTKWH